MNNQTDKKDSGKLRVTLVPNELVTAVAKVRTWATNNKYPDPEGWKNVNIERYRDAAYRHWLLYLDNPNGVDEESGLPHLYHLATNIAFLLYLEKYNYQEKTPSGRGRYGFDLNSKEAVYIMEDPNYAD